MRQCAIRDFLAEPASSLSNGYPCDYPPRLSGMLERRFTRSAAGHRPDRAVFAGFCWLFPDLSIIRRRELRTSRALKFLPAFRTPLRRYGSSDVADANYGKANVIHRQWASLRTTESGFMLNRAMAPMTSPGEISGEVLYPGRAFPVSDGLGAVLSADRRAWSIVDDTELNERRVPHHPPSASLTDCFALRRCTRGVLLRTVREPVRRR